MKDIEKVEAIKEVLKKVEETANTLKEHQWIGWNRVLEDIIKIIND